MFQINYITVKSGYRMQLKRRINHSVTSVLRIARVRIIPFVSSLFSELEDASQERRAIRQEQIHQETPIPFPLSEKPKCKQRKGSRDEDS